MMDDGNLFSEMPRRRWRDYLVIHPAANEVPAISEEELIALSSDIAANGLQYPITLLAATATTSQQLLDGRSRLDAWERLGRPTIGDDGQLLVNYETIEEPERVDALRLVKSLNLYRRHLTPAQRRKLAEAELKAHPERSDRQIAKTVGTSPQTVGRVRAKHDARVPMEHVSTDGCDDGMNATRTDSKGRHQPAHKPRRKGSDKKLGMVVPPSEQIALHEYADTVDATASFIIEETEEPLDIAHPIEGYAVQLRNLMWNALRQRPYAEWPRLAKRLRAEIDDLERSFDQLRRKWEADGKCE